jgi:hypothetical protein
MCRLRPQTPSARAGPTAERCRSLPGNTRRQHKYRQQEAIVMVPCDGRGHRDAETGDRQVKRLCRQTEGVEAARSPVRAGPGMPAAVPADTLQEGWRVAGGSPTTRCSSGCNKPVQQSVERTVRVGGPSPRSPMYPNTGRTQHARTSRRFATAITPPTVTVAAVAMTNDHRRRCRAPEEQQGEVRLDEAGHANRHASGTRGSSTASRQGPR